MADVSKSPGDQPFEAVVVFRDAAGNVAAAGGVPVWVSSDESVVTVVAAEDGLSAVVTVVAEGAADVQVSLSNPDGSVVSGSGHVAVVGAPAAAEVDFPAPAPAA